MTERKGPLRKGATGGRGAVPSQPPTPSLGGNEHGVMNDDRVVMTCSCGATWEGPRYLTDAARREWVAAHLTHGNKPSEADGGGSDSPASESEPTPQQDFDQPASWEQIDTVTRGDDPPSPKGEFWPWPKGQSMQEGPRETWFDRFIREMMTARRRQDL